MEASLRKLRSPTYRNMDSGYYCASENSFCLSKSFPGFKMRADAQHIAIATVARVDVLVSWNFKHIKILRRIHGYNSVNLSRGYPMLEIRTPREVLSVE